MRIRISAFARIREIIGAPELERSAPAGATAGEVWQRLTAEFPRLGELAASTRLVRNGSFVAGESELDDGDELALLPPFGGG
jgi:molybdopterin converting factor small subunit